MSKYQFLHLKMEANVHGAKMLSKEDGFGSQSNMLHTETGACSFIDKAAVKLWV